MGSVENEEGWDMGVYRVGVLTYGLCEGRPSEIGRWKGWGEEEEKGYFMGVKGGRGKKLGTRCFGGCLKIVLRFLEDFWKISGCESSGGEGERRFICWLTALAQDFGWLLTSASCLRKLVFSRFPSSNIFSTITGCSSIDQWFLRGDVFAHIDVQYRTS